MRSSLPRFRELACKSARIARSSKFYRWLTDVEVVRTCGVRVVGCTITGPTKYRGYTDGLRPDVMLVEETAGTRESNITSTLFPTLRQLILVEGHRQLRPHADIPGLANVPYNLKVSPFEQLVWIGIPFTTLAVQQRMSPAIREVLAPFYLT